MPDLPFRDRVHAGQLLAERLKAYAGGRDVVILALPRGGVPVAREIATRLNAPLDVFLVRKLGTPGQEELAMGAIAPGGVRVLNDDVVQSLRLSRQVIDAVAATEAKELARRERLYRAGRPPTDVAGRIVILVDDGLATGSTMRAAVKALRGAKPKRIIAAVPVAAPAACSQMAGEVDELVCLHAPDLFYSVGSWYEDFSQTSDVEIREALTAEKVQNATR